MISVFSASDRLVVVGARVVFDDELKSKLSEGRIHIFAVDLESFGCVLHDGRRLQVFAMCQHRATELVSFLNFTIKLDSNWLHAGGSSSGWLQ